MAPFRHQGLHYLSTKQSLCFGNFYDINISLIVLIRVNNIVYSAT